MSLENLTDEEVYNKIDQSPINQVRQMVEMMIRLKNSMVDVKKAVDEFNDSSSKQTNKVIKLTKWLFYLTTIVGVLTLLQLLTILK